MNALKEKIKLLRLRRSQRLLNRPLWPEKEHLNYLRNFSRRQKRLVYLSLICLFTQALLEISLILLSHRYLKNFSGLESVLDPFWLLFFISILSIFYLLSSFIAIKGERTLVVHLINDLRSRWFRLFLNKREEEQNLENKGVLIAKISYHLPLLSTGLTNSLAGVVRWLLLVSILLFLAFFFSYKLLIFVGLAIIFGLLIFAVAFWISYNYVTRETTFYSQIMRLVDFNLSDWQFVKKIKREREISAEFDNLVELDSYFRVRRDIWLRFSASLIFILLVFLAFFVGRQSDRLEYLLGTASLDARFIIIVVLVYFSRLLYESLRSGLYMVPLLLGLKLSVPKFSPRPLGSDRICHSPSLTFFSKKVKLFNKDCAYHRFSFEFVVGGRYLVVGRAHSGRSALARLFSGLAVYGRRAWLLRDENRRYFYNEFFDKYKGFYYLDPNFISHRSLLETVLGKEKLNISSADFTRVSNLISHHQELKKVFFEKEDWRLRADKFGHNARNIFLFQAIYCLLNPPRLLAFDHIWLESADEEILAVLRLLDEKLTDSSLIFFSNRKNDFLSYDKIYEI